MDSEMLLEGLRYLQTNRSFLGREFLTWLWYASETRKHKFSIAGLGEFNLYLDDKLVLSAASGSVHENALKGGTPGYASEARTALLSGKLVQEAKFILQQDDKQWMWAMRADDLSLRGVRLPPVMESEAAAHLAQRLSLMQVLIDVIDALFDEFMSLRLTARFQEEISDFSAWVLEKNTQEAYA